MQNGVGDKSSATPVVIENAEDDDVDMGSVESEEQVLNSTSLRGQSVYLK